MPTSYSPSMVLPVFLYLFVAAFAGLAAANPMPSPVVPVLPPCETTTNYTHTGSKQGNGPSSVAGISCTPAGNACKLSTVHLHALLRIFELTNVDSMYYIVI